MSEWISAKERKEFEAWRDAKRSAMAIKVEDMTLEITRFRMNCDDEGLRAEAQQVIDAIDRFHLRLRGKA